jgi:serine/threonine protein kinase
MENNLIQSKYKILETLGNEAMCIKYKVLNITNNEIYAIKQIPLNDDKDLEILKNEATILSSIQNENIVKYYDYFNENNYFNIVMEYCQGLDLKKYINKFKEEDKRIDRNSIYKYIIDICKGLKEIHSKNIIHKNIKPENLILTENNKIKICDFGIDKQLNYHTKTPEDNINYIAPEILNENNENEIIYNNKVDIWSLGCVIYELCTLRSCFSDNISISDLKNNTPNGDYILLDEELNNDYDLNDLIKNLLNKDYKQRFSADEILDYIKKNFKNQIKEINFNFEKEWNDNIE